jgi:uroporphyrinogen decarboxylase
MTSRERIEAAIEHAPPDRVPALWRDCAIHGAHTVTGEADGSWTDEWGTHCRPYDNLIFGEITHPIQTLDDLARYVPPDPLRPSRWEGVDPSSSTASGRYVMGSDGQTLFERLHFLVGMENCLAWLYEAPEAMAGLADEIVEFRIRELSKWGDLGVQGYFCGDDWGSQDRLMVSPTLWDAFFKPRYRRIFGHAKSLGMSTWLHCCGHILDIIPGLAEAGLDVIQSEQPACMGVERLVETCYGCITLNSLPDIQEFLPYATPEEVRAETLRFIELGHAREGWFVADTYAHWPEGIPAENVRVMMETFEQAEF